MMKLGKMLFVAIVLSLLVWFSDQETGFISNYFLEDTSGQTLISLYDKANLPSIMEVEPKDIYQTYLGQYRLKPDIRFVDAFKMLIDLYGRYAGYSDTSNPFSIGEVRITENRIIVPVFKKRKIIKTLYLNLPTSFPEQMKAMEVLLQTIGVSKNKTQLQRNNNWLNKQAAAISDFNMVDPRLIINGMLKLEQLREKSGDDSRLLLAAAKGYTVLLLGLEPDNMNYKDRFASYALSFLAFAKKIDPDIVSDKIETMLAMNMGYTAYANELLKSMAYSKKSAGLALEAYVRKDIKALKNTKSDDLKLLENYLLTRLYRQMGLNQLSHENANELLKKSPHIYPVIVEAIHSTDLNTAKKITTYYPMDILVRMRKKISLSPIDEQKTWTEELKTFQGEQNNGDISFTRFNKMLTLWSPFDDKTAHGFFINNDDVKHIYKALYSGAVYLRFNLLLNRWSVVQKAENFVTAFRNHDPNHPLVMQMTAEVLNETGNKKDATALFIRVITHPKVSSVLALRAHAFLDNYSLTRNRLSPALASCLDGRPANLAGMGHLFYRNLHFDFAEKFYAKSLEYDPFSFANYYSLAKVTGDDNPLTIALKNFPDNIKILKSAGNYYAAKEDIASRKSAYRCLKKAVNLAPSNSSIVKSLARILVKMNRYDEAIHVIKSWINNFGSRKLDTTIMWDNIADIHLRTDQPLSAMEILIDNSDTYWLARFYLGNGSRHETINMIKRNIKTYKTAHHLLKNDYPGKASKVLISSLNNDTYELLKNYVKDKKYYQGINSFIKGKNTFTKIISYLKNEDQQSAIRIIMEQIKTYQMANNNLDKLIISCIDTEEHDFALKILEMTLKRYQKAIDMLKNEKDKETLALISKNIDDYYGGAIAHTARIYEELNQYDLAEKTFNKGLKRHFTSGHMFSKAAAFMWRNGKYNAAAVLIANGNKNKEKFSEWYHNDFIEAFSQQPDDLVIKAVESLIEHGADKWHIGRLGYMFFFKNRPETAYKIIAKTPAHNMMLNLEKIADQYILLKSWKGENEASDHVLKKTKGDTRSLFAMVLFAKGHYELALKILEKPDSFSRFKEFVWLQKLMAWLAMEKIPKEIGNELEVHYSKVSSNTYHAIGRFLLEKLSMYDLLELIKTPKQRCEFTYYIGFRERMKGNFSEAANWYQICKETLLENNGEFHWASDELFWWGHMGTKGRHRLLKNDIKTYHKKM